MLFWADVGFAQGKFSILGIRRPSLLAGSEMFFPVMSRTAFGEFVLMPTCAKVVENAVKNSAENRILFIIEI